MSIDLSQFLETFYEESFEGLETMEQGLLSLDVGATDVDLINSIFRAAHSIKGGSGTFGLQEVANFTHVMETLLDELRDGRREVTQPTVDRLLQSVDCLREMLTALREGGEVDEQRVAEVKEQLEALLGGEHGSTGPGTAESTDAADTDGGWILRFKPHPHMLRTGNDPLRMFRELKSLGELAVKVDNSGMPPFADFDPEECHLAWELTLAGEVPKTRVEEVFEWVEDECDLEILPLQGDTPPVTAQAETPVPEMSPAVSAPAPPAARPAARPNARQGRGAAEASSIRVGTEKIDALINMVGELVITQSMLGQIGESLDDFDMAKVEKLRDGLADLERNTRELQESVMRIRMLPISFAFNRFPRLVHDLSQQLGKKVELKLSGEQTELDKTVMEKIGDPLVHLVRNALDHGIESPEKRRAAGKPETGILHLNAYHQGGNIVIEISDDGAGFNKERILKKAAERGIVAPEEVLPDERIFDLVFQPGFSTAETVSDVSGRGVGMDVVKRNITDLGGAVEVSSEEGKGATFTVRLPLTLAILDGQLVRVGDTTYIVSLVSIIESLQPNAGQLNVVAGKAELYRLRDEYIPVVRLYDVFGLVPQTTDLSDGLLVVVEGDGQKAALFVDDLLGQQQVVIKSLESNFQRVDGVAGATILGDGTVALILDVGGLVRLYRGLPPRGMANGERGHRDVA